MSTVNTYDPSQLHRLHSKHIRTDPTAHGKALVGHKEKKNKNKKTQLVLITHEMNQLKKVTIFRTNENSFKDGKVSRFQTCMSFHEFSKAMQAGSLFKHLKIYWRDLLYTSKYTSTLCH